MKTFPMFLAMSGRRVVIAGGGEQAAQKARLMLRTEARLVLVAETLDAELAHLVATGRAHHHSGPVTPETFREAAIAFIATGCPAADAALHALARAAGALVNVVDRPELCDAITPSLVDRDPVVVAIGTEGTAPVLAREIKTRIEAMLEPELGALAALAGRLRDEVARRIPRARRRAFWEWAFSGSPRRLHAEGRPEAAASALKAAIASGTGMTGAKGSISLVGAGPGASDLLTLRAVQRLQEADVIYYDRLVDPQVLDLARRDAERVFVGKEVGACAWPQDRINGVIVAAARRGMRVVRLKSGDPGIFGRATEELDAARSAGIPVEIVPGITAATAAAAALGRPLTERGQTDRVVLATGTCIDGDEAPDWGALLSPGTTLALYMAMGKLEELQRNLRAAGLGPDTGVEIVAEASHRAERVVQTTVGRLASDVAAAGLRNPAIIFLRRPKAEAGQVGHQRQVA